MDGGMDLRVLIIMIHESFMIILSADLDVHCWPCFDHIFTLGKRFNTYILFRLEKLVDNSRCRLYIFNVIMVVIHTAIVIIIVMGIVIIEFTANMILNLHQTASYLMSVTHDAQYVLLYTKCSAYFIISRPSYTMFNVPQATTEQR